jgi:hypothetical protein
MGVSAEYRALARRMRSLPEQMVRAGAVEMQRGITAELKSDTGGDQALSGFGKSRRGRRAKMATTVTVTGGTALATATVKASGARGMWTIIEEGTGERVVGRLTRKTSGPGGKHMTIGGQWRTGPWSAGRSPAKHTFTDGVERGTAPAERAMTEAWEQVVR